MKNKLIWEEGTDDVVVFRTLDLESLGTNFQIQVIEFKNKYEVSFYREGLIFNSAKIGLSGRYSRAKKTWTYLRPYEIWLNELLPELNRIAIKEIMKIIDKLLIGRNELESCIVQRGERKIKYT